MLGEDTTKFVEQTLDKWTMSHFFLYSNDDILLMILKLSDNDRVAVWIVVDGYRWLWIDMEWL